MDGIWRGVEVDQTTLRRLLRALRQEADGKTLKSDLVRELRKAAEPARDAARTAVLSIDSHSGVVPDLRAAVARSTRISVRTTGRVGVSIRASKRGMPRGFLNAPQRLNSRRGWRHPFFGDRERWYAQMGKPGWFDDSISPFAPAAREGAAQALERVAKRIDYTTKG